MSTIELAHTKHTSSPANVGDAQPSTIAREYADAGLAPIRIAKREKKPIGKGWQHAPVDPDAVDRWLDEGGNVGLRMGEQPSGAFIVAIDEDEAGAIERAEAEHGPLPETLTSRTGSGGQHRLFTWPADLPKPKNSVRALAGIDVRSEGGQIVVEPSTHPSGGAYAWTSPTSDIATLPEAWAKVLLANAKPPASGVAATTTPQATARVDRVVGILYATYSAGPRHDLVRAIGGWLARFPLGAWTDEEIAAVVERLPSDQIPTRIEQALLAADQARNGEPTPGWDVLERRLGENKARQLETGARDEWWTRIAGGTTNLGRRLRAANDDTSWAKPDAPSTPETLVTPAGKGFAALADYVRARAAVAYDVRQLAIVRVSDGRRWSDADTASLRLELSAQNLEAKKDTLADVVELVAHESEFDPVVRYLEGLPAWDGVTRSAFVQHFGAAPDRWSDACWRVFSLSAVARAIDPGCKVDTMICLEGAQGQFKSSGLRALAGGAFFSDTILVLDSPKQAIEGLMGVWIQEVAELSGLRGRDAERIKASLSSPEDRARLAYGRFTEAIPRRSVFIATRNPDGSQWLVDPTGNRRYLPLSVGRVDVAGITRDRDQLWAEALHRYRAGEPWWLHSTEGPLHSAATDERTEGDPWEESIRVWLKKGPKSEVTISAMFDPETGAVPTAAERQTHALANRAARVLKTLGYVRRQVRRGTERRWVYIRGVPELGAVSPPSVTSFKAGK